MMKRNRMSLVILSVIKLKGDEVINGDDLWACLSLS